MSAQDVRVRIQFARLRADAVVPCKRGEDAGYDVYAAFDADCIILQPMETRKIPTGIASACPPEYCFILKERGSTGARGIAQRCGVIDSGYRGEWLVPVTNLGARPLAIAKRSVAAEADALGYDVYPAEKAIAQALLVPVPRAEITEVTPEELARIPSERGAGGYGSSGK